MLLYVTYDTILLIPSVHLNIILTQLDHYVLVSTDTDYVYSVFLETKT